MLVLNRAKQYYDGSQEDIASIPSVDVLEKPLSESYGRDDAILPAEFTPFSNIWEERRRVLLLVTAYKKDNAEWQRYAESLQSENQKLQTLINRKDKLVTLLQNILFDQKEKYERLIDSTRQNQ